MKEWKKNQIFDGFYKITKSRIELDLDSVPIFSHFTDQFLSKISKYKQTRVLSENIEFFQFGDK